MSIKYNYPGKLSALSCPSHWGFLSSTSFHKAWDIPRILQEISFKSRGFCVVAIDMLTSRRLVSEKINHVCHDAYAVV